MLTSYAHQFPPHPLFALPWKDKNHVRFFLSPKALPRIALPYIIERGPQYGILSSPSSEATPSEPPSTGGEGRKTILVEFSSPNLGQDFRIDHLRSTILGAFVANAHESMGWRVVRTNYLGDWGKHIGTLNLGWERHVSPSTGDGEDEGKTVAERFRRIHDVYAKMAEEIAPQIEAQTQRRKVAISGNGKAGETANGSATGETKEEQQEELDDSLIVTRDAAFKKLEDADPSAIQLWEKIRATSVEYYQPTYQRLGIVFDDYSGESIVCRNREKVEAVEATLREKGISEQGDDGCWVVNFGNHGAARLGSGQLRSKDGTTTYLLRDVATVLDRWERYAFDKMVYVVGEQDLHFRQVFMIVKLMGLEDVADKLHHLTFVGGQHHKRSWGEDLLLGDILDRCESYTLNLAEVDPEEIPDGLHSEEKIRMLGINALVVQELNTKNRAQHANAIAETLVATGGETGLGLQLGYARLCAAIEQLGTDGSRDGGEVDFSALWEPPWIELLRLLVRFPAVTGAAYRSSEPWGVLSYLFLVLDELGYCLDEDDEDDEEGGGHAEADKFAPRALLFRATKQVLENGMRFLNITPVS